VAEPGDFFQWNDENASEELNIRVSPARSRMYVFTVKDSLTGCEITDSVEVLVDILPEIFAGIDTVICPLRKYRNRVTGHRRIDAVFGLLDSRRRTRQSQHRKHRSHHPDNHDLCDDTRHGSRVCSARFGENNSFRYRISDTGPDTTICDGDAVVLRANASGGDPPYLYEWTPAVRTERSFQSQDSDGLSRYKQPPIGSSCAVHVDANSKTV
jgi:hypothetical protein